MTPNELPKPSANRAARMRLLEKWLVCPSGLRALILAHTLLVAAAFAKLLHIDHLVVPALALAGYMLILIVLLIKAVKLARADRLFKARGVHRTHRQSHRRQPRD